METVVSSSPAAHVMACLVDAAFPPRRILRRVPNPMAAPDILGASWARVRGRAGDFVGASNRMITMFAFVSSMVTVIAVFLIAQRCRDCAS
jgi:ABC-type Fe3+-siderophore transport system permease subunit